MRVFLCDDNAEYRALARAVLRDTFEIVGEAGDGGEAIERAPHARPDVLLLDLNMPRVDGYEALPRLREVLPDTKIVVLTSGQAIDEEARSLAAGAHAFIAKPQSVLTLATELEAALRAPGA